MILGEDEVWGDIYVQIKIIKDSICQIPHPKMASSHEPFGGNISLFRG